jgi:hypothetical protein
MKRHYILDLQCPQCGSKSQRTIDSLAPHSEFKCEKCQDAKLKLKNITVVPGVA